jgi:hypothetical protein
MISHCFSPVGKKAKKGEKHEGNQRRPKYTHMFCKELSMAASRMVASFVPVAQPDRATDF